MSNHQISSIFCLLIYLHIEVAVFGARAMDISKRSFNVRARSPKTMGPRPRMTSKSMPMAGKGVKMSEKTSVERGKGWKKWQTTSYRSHVSTLILKIQPTCFFRVVYRFFAPLSPMYWLIDFRHDSWHTAIPLPSSNHTVHSVPQICHLRGWCLGAWVGGLTPHPVMMLGATSSTSIRIRMYTETNKHI